MAPPPESRMLLRMQGLFAEYERAKIMESTRRGKMQRAREGALVGGHAPYGYSWGKRSENGRARIEIDEYQAAVARRKHVALDLKRIKAQEDRVTDLYINEAMDLARYKTEMDGLKSRRREREQVSQEIDRRMKQEEASRNALSQLEALCGQVAQGLEHMTFEERQQLLRLIVERVTVKDGRVKVETVIPTERGDGPLRNARGEPVGSRRRGIRLALRSRRGRVAPRRRRGELRQ